MGKVHPVQSAVTIKTLFMQTKIILTQENLTCLESARKIIERNQHITIEDLAKMVGLNRKKLKYGFKTTYGMTINQYEIHLKMQKAIDLMFNSHNTLSQIAVRVGYKNIMAFSSAFKKVHGLPPRTWRNQQNGKVHNKLQKFR
jgi:AraC-like DNA-binding protein